MEKWAFGFWDLETGPFPFIFCLKYCMNMTPEGAFFPSPGWGVILGGFCCSEILGDLGVFQMRKFFSVHGKKYFA